MAKRIDITGQQYDQLKVLKEIEQIGYHRMFLCECKCGNVIPVRMNNLRTGHTKSCGCAQQKSTSEANTDDLTGREFGRLKVIKRADKKSTKTRHVFWECECKCGTPVIVDGAKLRSQETQSCGCLRSDAGRSVQDYNNDNLINDGVFIPLLNSKIRSDNSTGFKGVSPKRRKNGTIVYSASICVKGKTYWLGEHPTIEAAAAARRAGEEKYHKPYMEEQHDA